MQDQGILTHFYSSVNIYIYFLLSHSIDFQWRSIKLISLRMRICHPVNPTNDILSGSAPIRTVAKRLLSIVFSLFCVQRICSVTSYLVCLRGGILIKKNNVKFTHCALYCVAPRSSWNFINSVSFIVCSFTALLTATEGEICAAG